MTKLIQVEKMKTSYRLSIMEISKDPSSSHELTIDNHWEGDVQDDIVIDGQAE